MNGKCDGFESYTVPNPKPLPFPISFTQFPQIPGKSHLDPSLARPPLLASRLPSLTAFLTQTHRIFALLLSSLSSSLGLPSNASLANLHRENAPSPDIFRLLHYLPQPPSETGAPQAAHTDLGSLTLLFTKTPGLQVLPPHSCDWASVVPKPGCAIVNIGDGLTMLTGGLLHSCLHRVSPPAGRAMEERYSFAYLQRAENEVRMEALPGITSGPVNKGDVYTSREWLKKKFGMLRRKTWKEGIEGQKILTGRIEVPPA